MEILRSKGSGSTAVVQYMDLGIVLVRFCIVRNKISMLNTSKICIMCLYMTAYVANVYNVYVYCDFPLSIMYGTLLLARNVRGKYLSLYPFPVQRFSTSSQ